MTGLPSNGSGAEKSAGFRNEPREVRYAGTMAAKMLAEGLKKMSDRDGLSLRQLAKKLDHKQPAMLSQWAIGRVPIPVERVAELADALELDERSFLLAVLKQRHPQVHWIALEDEHTPGAQFVQELEAIIKGPIEDLYPGQRRVMREAAADSQADRRWLSVPEASIIQLIRELRPQIVESGLSEDELATIRTMLTKRVSGTSR